MNRTGEQLIQIMKNRFSFHPELLGRRGALNLPGIQADGALKVFSTRSNKVQGARPAGRTTKKGEPKVRPDANIRIDFRRFLLELLYMPDRPDIDILP